MSLTLSTEAPLVRSRHLPVAPLRLLCVEDNDADFTLLKEHLRGASELMPVQIQRCVRLADALRLLESDPDEPRFDAVLLDLTLPDSHGIETFEAVHAAAPNTAITVLSGSSDEEMALATVQLGAQDFLPKDTLDSDMLRRAIMYAGERQRLRSDMRRLNEQLLAAQNELKTAQMDLIQAEKLDSLGRIAASVAHEVKNPLATLQMGVDFFETRVATLGPVGAQMVACMQSAIQRAERIIHEMLDFSRSDQLKLRRCKANQVAADALRMILPELLERHISVTEDYDLADPFINADIGKLEQVLINLLINSSQAMDDGGTIRLRTRCLTISGLTPDPGLREMDLLKDGDQAVIIEIRDSGPGIPADLMNRVFEPFFTTKPTGQGTGLGLPVAKRIIELHRGILQVKNTLLPPGLSVRITLKADLISQPNQT